MDTEGTDVDTTTNSQTKGVSRQSSLSQQTEKPVRHASRPSRSASRASRASDDSDPLSPLELAISQGYGVDDEDYDREAISHIRTTTSIGSSASRPPDFEVVFEEDDPENPRNWARGYRAWIAFVISYTTWTVVLYSTSYTASLPGLTSEFNSSTTIATLGLTSYLLGLAVGSLIVAPASEFWGRQPVYIVCMVIFTLLVIPAGLATSLPEIIVMRFIA
jgi:hypothetical protein